MHVGRGILRGKHNDVLCSTALAAATLTTGPACATLVFTSAAITTGASPHATLATLAAHTPSTTEEEMQSAPRQLALIHGCQMRVGATMWHHALGVAVAVLLAASTLGKHSTRRMPAVEQWRARRCKFSRGFIA